LFGVCSAEGVEAEVGCCEGEEDVSGTVRVMMKVPEVEGMRATSPRVREKVCRSSWAYCASQRQGSGKGREVL
jgi:hypothetical protein